MCSPPACATLHCAGAAQPFVAENTIAATHYAMPPPQEGPDWNLGRNKQCRKLCPLRCSSRQLDNSISIQACPDTLCRGVPPRSRTPGRTSRACSWPSRSRTAAGAAGPSTPRETGTRPSTCARAAPLCAQPPSRQTPGARPARGLHRVFFCLFSNEPLQPHLRGAGETSCLIRAPACNACTALVRAR